MCARCLHAQTDMDIYFLSKIVEMTNYSINISVVCWEMNRIEGVPINVLSNKSHKFIKIDNGRSSRSLQMTLSSSRHIIILLASRCTLLDNALPVLLILKSYGNWATIDNVLNYLFSMLTCLRRIKASYLYSNVKSKVSFFSPWVQEHQPVIKKQRLLQKEKVAINLQKNNHYNRGCD